MGRHCDCDEDEVAPYDDLDPDGKAPLVTARPFPVPGGWLYKGRFWPRHVVQAALLRLLTEHYDPTPRPPNEKP